MMMMMMMMIANLKVAERD